jgi:hypothetical protein
MAKNPHQPITVNGWTISTTELYGNVEWLAVKNGIIGIQHKDKFVVTKFAGQHDNPLPKK